MSATGEPAAAPSSGEAGTTLVEMLVVVAVLAAAGGVAFPLMGGALERSAFQEAAVGLDADLHMARAQALRTGEPVTLQVRDDGRGYGWSPGPQRALLAGLALAPAGGALAFYPDGSSGGGALRLANARAAVTLSVDPVTGRIGDAAP